MKSLFKVLIGIVLIALFTACLIMIYDSGVRQTSDHTCYYLDNGSEFNPSYSNCYDGYCNSTADAWMNQQYKKRLCDCCRAKYGGG
jgi:uncharacterized protein YecT (DUF1311 family)